jgi:elongation factor 1 alpha-like protein
MPVGLPLTIKGIEQDGKQARYASAGDNVELGVTGIDPSALRYVILS